MALHPIMAAAIAPFAPPTRDEYRDFEIDTHDWAGWQAVHKDYDGPEDSRAFTGRTRVEVVEQIDEWHEDQVDALLGRLKLALGSKRDFDPLLNIKAGDVRDAIAEIERLRAATGAA